MKDDSVKILNEINKKLDTLIILMAGNLIGNNQIEKPQKVILLDLAGFTSKQIGEMLSMNTGSIRNILSATRRKRN